MLGNANDSVLTNDDVAGADDEVPGPWDAPCTPRPFAGTADPGVASFNRGMTIREDFE